MEFCNLNAALGQHVGESLWFGDTTHHFNRLILKRSQFDCLSQAIDGMFTELASGFKTFRQSFVLRVQQQIYRPGPWLGRR